MSEIQTFVTSDFRHSLLSENQDLGSDFKDFMKVSEILTINVRISDDQNCLESKQLLTNFMMTDQVLCKITDRTLKMTDLHMTLKLTSYST